MKRASFPLLLLFQLLTCCGTDQEVRVLVPAPLADSFQDVAKVFEQRYPDVHVRVLVRSGVPTGSEVRAADVDVLVSDGDAVKSSSLLAGTPDLVVGSSLALVTSPNAAVDIAGATDLRTAGVRLAACVATAPCGAATERALKHLHLSDVTPTVTSEDTTGVLASVETRKADAGFVLWTDAKAAGAKVRVVPTRGTSADIFWIAPLQDSSRREFSDAFARFAGSDRAFRIFRQAGFLRAYHGE